MFSLGLQTALADELLEESTADGGETTDAEHGAHPMPVKPDDSDTTGSEHRWQFPARCTRVVDGDTIELIVDLGFDTRRSVTARLVGVNTHEIHGVTTESAEYQRGITEKEFVTEWVDDANEPADWPLYVYSDRRGKFGRSLARIERRTDGRILNDDILEAFDDVVY